MPRLTLSAAAGALALILLAIAGCGGKDNPRLTLGLGCTLNSDCADPLLCKFGKCHRACVESARDCDPGQRCVQVDGAGVCQQQAVCGGGCAAPLSCGPDMQCRNTCSPEKPCAGSQVCVAIGDNATTRFCADTGEAVVTGGAGADAGAPGVGSDAGTGADAPVPPTTDAVGDGSDATVVAETATSGDQAPAAACGMAAESACCADMTCGANLACSKAVNRCTCVDKCGGWYVLRKDGKIIWKGNNVLKGADGQPFTAPGALDFTGGFYSGVYIEGGCVVTKEGAAWCWGANADGQLGAGSTNPSSASPRQVVNSARTPLAGVRKVSGNSTANTFCAVTDDGKIWCWGNGSTKVLGPGNTADSNVALPLLLTPGGEPASGFVDVALEEFGACGLKSDGSVWCWGHFTSINPVQINLLDAATSLGCGTYLCCVTTAKDQGVSCWNKNAPTAPAKLTLPGGAAVTGATSVHSGGMIGMYASVNILKNDQTVLHVSAHSATAAPTTVGNAALSAPYAMGRGCFVTPETRTLPADWVPFCE